MVNSEKSAVLLELLLQTSKAITSEVDLEKLVQRITDMGTSLSGAQFGAFFYNVENAAGEKYLLYTISGAPKEAFSKFQMPRNTKIFHPTFSGTRTVRYDDVTKAADYGKNPPYFGMPKGHLPVRSYLAVPVISALNKGVIGGLFFGHSNPGVFTPETEILIEGIAAQASIAMENAQLFEEKKQTEKHLLKQKEQYKSVFNSTSDAIIICDENGTIVDVNTAAETLLGHRQEELIQTNGKEVLAKMSIEFEGVKELIKSGRQYMGTAVFQKNDGPSLNLEITGRSFPYHDKAHLLIIIRDTTIRKQTEETLEENEAFIHAITKASPVCLWICNDKGDMAYINQTWIDWTGREYQEQLGDGWLKSILPDDREKVKKGFGTSIQKRKTIDVDFRINRRDGEIRWCVANGSPYYKTDGTFQGYAGSCADITERKLAEDALASQNVLIQTIANNTRHALFMMDDKQRCRYMNPAAEQMIGFKLEEVQDKPLHYYIHHTHPDGRHFPIEECPIDRALPQKNQTKGEEMFIHKDGHFFPVAFTASPIIENGIPKGTVIEVRDITYEKRIQQELQKKETLAKEMLEQKVKERTAELEKTNYELLQFTSVASHDLKEPLRKISIFSKLLREKITSELPPELQKYLDNIISSSTRMAELIDDLLVFSRVSQSNPKFIKVDLNQLMQQIVQDFEISIIEKKATINYSTLPVIDGIPSQLGQVFQNLISNSLKFTHPHRKPVIQIVCELAGSEEFKQCKISYSDNGIGFKNHYAEKIFEIFQRLHSKDEYEGTGVGLAIVKKIITLHKGTIKAYGRENEGSTFEICLPMQQ